MPIRTPIVSEIGPKTYVINEFGLDAMFLVVGTERAMVIDTGTGYCDFRSVVEKLTDKPYIVVLTHGHVDHAGGVDQFEKIYIHPADIEMAKSISLESRANYGEVLRGMVGDPDVFAYTKEDVREWKSFPETIDLYDGQIFDLGGRSVKVIHTPGHTPGSCSLIDDKSRILFSGDAANGNTLVRMAVSTELKSALKLKSLEAEYDRNYNGHIGYSSNVTCVSMPDGMVGDVIAACRSILDGTGEVIKYSGFLGSTQESTAVQHGMARVTFIPDMLWEEGEEKKSF